MNKRIVGVAHDEQKEAVSVHIGMLRVLCAVLRQEKFLRWIAGVVGFETGEVALDVGQDFASALVVRDALQHVGLDADGDADADGLADGRAAAGL